MLNLIGMEGNSAIYAFQKNTTSSLQIDLC